jgi:hypothetical protein
MPGQFVGSGEAFSTARIYARMGFLASVGSDMTSTMFESKESLATHSALVSPLHRWSGGGRFTVHDVWVGLRFQSFVVKEQEGGQFVERAKMDLVEMNGMVKGRRKVQPSQFCKVG